MIGFTTVELLNLWGVCEKASVDGTFKIAPKYWTQVFITMIRYGDKWVPSVFSLLQNKDIVSYRVLCEMIKWKLEEYKISMKVKGFICDF